MKRRKSVRFASPRKRKRVRRHVAYNEIIRQVNLIQDLTSSLSNVLQYASDHAF
jgi:hypothetical protein